jgi:hypothetical protein
MVLPYLKGFDYFLCSVILVNGLVILVDIVDMF